MITRILGLAAFLFLAAHRASPPPRQPSNSATPLPAGVTVIRTQERFLDLATAPEASTQEVEAMHLVAVRLDNRAPGLRYHVKREVHRFAGGPSRVDELDLPAESAFVPEAPARCHALRASVAALLTAADEAQTAERVRALQKLLPDGNCRALEDRARSTIDRTRVLLPRPTNLSFGDELKVTVQRVDPGNGSPGRTWQAHVVVTPPNRAWTYGNEFDWLVGEIGHDLVEMVLYARDRSLAEDDALSYRLAAAPADGPPGFRLSFVDDGHAVETPTIEIRDHVWSPATYRPVARWLLDRNGPPRRSAGTTDPQSALAALTEPRGPIIEQENQRVSAWLARDMLDPDAHEHAAVVLAALGLREASGRLTDLRPTLSRMTAHLALARALRPQPGVHGRYAEVTLLALAGRERAALARLPPSAPASAAERAWQRALRVRITRDWRALAGAGEATLLERLQQFRALDASMGGRYALEYLTAGDAELIGDWGAVALWDASSLRERASVAEGNVLARSSLSLTVDEARAVLSSAREEPVGEAAFALALDEPPGRCLRRHEVLSVPQVIGRGDWARFYQRRLLHLIAANRLHLEKMLGQPAEAERFATEAQASFGKLTLYPLVHPFDYRARRDARVEFWRGAAEAACAAAGELVSRQPQAVPPWSWDELRIQCGTERQTGAIPPVFEWYPEPVPHGTAYDAAARIQRGSPRAKASDGARALRDIAPYEPQLAFLSLPEKRTARDITETLGPLLGYSLLAMRSQALQAWEEPARYRRLFGRICDLDADSCLELADYLQQRGLDEAATAAAYERALEHARDRVGVSNSSDWLADYHFDRGNEARAVALATMAAGVGSGGGLATMGRVLERMGRYEEAEALYTRVKEAYGRDTTLNEFYLRFEHRVGSGRFAAQAAQARQRLFPRGLQRVNAASFAGQRGPAEGMPVDRRVLDMKLWRFGLRSGDHLVALDGYRVQNAAQFRAVLGFTDAPQMTALVWREGRYVEVSGAFKRIAYGPRRGAR